MIVLPVAPAHGTDLIVRREPLFDAVHVKRMTAVATTDCHTARDMSSRPLPDGMCATGQYVRTMLQPSPISGSLHCAQAPSNGLRQMPHVSSFKLHFQYATALTFLYTTFIVTK